MSSNRPNRKRNQSLILCIKSQNQAKTLSRTLLIHATSAKKTRRSTCLGTLKGLIKIDINTVFQMSKKLKNKSSSLLTWAFQQSNGMNNVKKTQLIFLKNRRLPKKIKMMRTLILWWMVTSLQVHWWSSRNKTLLLKSTSIIKMFP
jgi:hypothetical protein